VFTTGIAIFLSLVFIFIKLRRRTMLRLLSHDMALDVGVKRLIFTAASLAQKAADFLLPSDTTSPNPQTSALATA
jgi:hypothetical protein